MPYLKVTVFEGTAFEKEITKVTVKQTAKRKKFLQFRSHIPCLTVPSVHCSEMFLGCSTQEQFTNIWKNITFVC